MMWNLSRATILGLLWGSAAAWAGTPGDVGPNTHDGYVKECGPCHFAFQPGFLPERSWRSLMGNLSDHFGERAELKPAERDTITAYLVANAADHADNLRSREVMSTLKPSDTPLRVTAVLYLGGIHGGFLDPRFLGQPRVKTLADCAACHPKAAAGRFVHRRYTVSDELFRVLSGD